MSNSNNSQCCYAVKGPSPNQDLVLRSFQDPTWISILKQSSHYFAFQYLWHGQSCNITDWGMFGTRRLVHPQYYLMYSSVECNGIKAFVFLFSSWYWWNGKKTHHDNMWWTSMEQVWTCSHSLLCDQYFMKMSFTDDNINEKNHNKIILKTYSKTSEK